jgi:hypothetical protein
MFQISFQALNYSCDRQEFGAYLVLNGTQYADVDPSQLPLKLLQRLCQLQKQSFDNTLKFEDLLEEFKFSRDTVLLLHKFNVTSCDQFAMFVNGLLSIVNTRLSLKIVITAPSATLHAKLPKVFISLLTPVGLCKHM